MIFRNFDLKTHCSTKYYNDTNKAFANKKYTIQAFIRFFKLN